ncbi:uncharacterized protein LOC127081217 [Lathyrus oleraceus]|uniref:uncharacterized protein LOC127081217 n=1 Tax=Pisum sativum TaxID=3888 RepID=UPI0021CED720|nr:uncharacterized protein LOC127081217 [Pisum sativum]
MGVTLVVLEQVGNETSRGEASTSIGCSDYREHGDQVAASESVVFISSAAFRMLMNWLELNRVFKNCFYKLVQCVADYIYNLPQERESEFDEGEELMFISTKQVNEFMKDDFTMFMILAYMKAETKVILDELPRVSDFPEVFPHDISDLSPEREVKFSIYLVHGTSPMLMAPYRMYTSEFGEI